MEGFLTAFFIKVFAKEIIIRLFRYIDDILMVTNEPVDEIKHELQTAKGKDGNIEIEVVIGTAINYLDVMLTNENEQLKTNVYHKPTAEPYYLPYRSDHPHRYHRNIPYSAILRAARICSNIDDFNQERLRIEVTLLLNNYPPQMISKEFLRFFRVHNTELLNKQLDDHLYQQLHAKLLRNSKQPTKASNYSIEEHVQNPRILQQKSYDRKLMYIKYNFQTGTTTKFSQQFFHWWHKHYAYTGSPVNNVQVRLLPKTNSKLEQLLIHKKPTREILQRMETTNE